MAEEAKGRRKPMFCCGTPKEFCNGSKCLDEGCYHADRASVMACQRRHLLKQGYIQLSPREFQAPGDGPVLVMNRKPARAKPGKTSNGYMSRPSKIRPSVPGAIK